MEFNPFRLSRSALLQNVQEEESDEGKETLEAIITLNNFQFSPNTLQVNINSKITVKVQENNREFSGIYHTRAFILAIEQLELESPPLLPKDTWTFQIQKQGKFQVECINYCKLSFAINVLPEIQAFHSSSPFLELVDVGQQIITNSQILVKQKQNQKPAGRNEYEACTYEEFETLITEEMAKFDEIPMYLLQCFKTQLDILNKTGSNQLIEQPKVPFNCREHSTNTEECSVYESFDDNRRVVDVSTPHKSKALTCFEDEERGQLQIKGLKKTSSQLLNLDWKQEMEKKQKSKQRSKSKTFDEEINKLSWEKDTQILLPSNSQAVNNIMTILKNRISIIKYMV